MKLCSMNSERLGLCSCLLSTDFAREIEVLLRCLLQILCQVSPNNPSGAVTPPEVVREIAALAIKHDLLVLSDEIYADMM